MKVIAVILHFGNLQYTLDCYNDLKVQSNNIVDKIIIVNNDGNPDLNSIMADSKLDILQSENNDGYAKGNNLALNFIKNNYACDYVIIVNNDVRMEYLSTIEGLIAEMKDRRSMAISPMIKGKTGDTALTINSRFYNRMFDVLIRRNPELKNYKHDMLSGCFMIIDFGAFMRLNFIDESFFMYGEDDFLSIQLFLSGAGTLRSNNEQLSIIHFGGVQQLALINNQRKLKLIGRNRIILMKKLKIWDDVTMKVTFALSFFKGVLDFVKLKNLKGLSSYTMGVLLGLKEQVENTADYFHQQGKTIFLGNE